MNSVKLFKIRREEYRKCASSDSQLVFGDLSITHCYSAFFCEHLDIDDHTSGRVVSGLDVTRFLVNLPSTHE